jgi:hypothetical protein
MAVTAAEIRAILTLQDQLSGQLSKVQGELQKLGASAGAAGNAAKSAGPSWVSMSTAIARISAAVTVILSAPQRCWFASLACRSMAARISRYSGHGHARSWP